MKKAFISCLVFVAVLLSGCGSASVASEPVKTTLYTAVQDGSASIRITPKGIEESEIDITNKTESSMKIAIEPGTYLVSASDKIQNMLITDPTTLTLVPGKTETFSLKTACMNIKRAIPKAGAIYSIGQLENDNLLIKAVGYFDEKNYGNDKYGLIQAVVWLITDNPTYEQMKSLRTSSGQYVIGFPDYSSAVQIVKDLKSKE